MPTRKVTERERLTLYARQATDEQLEEALEILRIEARIRAGQKGTANSASKPKKAASKKPAAAASPNPAPPTDVEG